MEKLLDFVGGIPVTIFIMNIVILMAFGPVFLNEETQFSGLMAFYKFAYYILWAAFLGFGSLWIFKRVIK